MTTTHNQAPEPEKYLLVTIEMMVAVTDSAALRKAAADDYDQTAWCDGYGPGEEEDAETREGIAGDDAYAALSLANPDIDLTDLFGGECGLGADGGTNISVSELDADTYEQALAAWSEYGRASHTWAGLRKPGEDERSVRYGLPGHAPGYPYIIGAPEAGKADGPVRLAARCTCGHPDCWWTWQSMPAVHHPGEPALSVRVADRRRHRGITVHTRIQRSTVAWADEPHEVTHLDMDCGEDGWWATADAEDRARAAGITFAREHGYEVAGEFCDGRDGGWLAALVPAGETGAAK